MIWGCICYDGVGTLTAVEGNINSAKYIDILDKNLWPVVVWYFEGKEYFFVDDNAPVHRAHPIENYLFTSFSGHRPAQRECARIRLRSHARCHPYPIPQFVKVGHTTGVYGPYSFRIVHDVGSFTSHKTKSVKVL